MFRCGSSSPQKGHTTIFDVNSVNVFKARLDRFWMDQDVKYDFTADLTGTGDITSLDRSVNVISET